jgi:fibronectin type 3 domain-containing protein
LDLSWAINPATNVVGYNVYRSEQEGAPGMRLNPELLLTPAFRDMNAVLGRPYFYTVTAVDRSGNESAASAAASGGIPAESQSKP